MDPKVQAVTGQGHLRNLLAEQQQLSREMSDSKQRTEQAFLNQQREQQTISDNAARTNAALLSSLPQTASLEEVQRLADQVFANHTQQSKDSLQVIINKNKEQAVWIRFESARRDLDQNRKRATSQVDLSQPEKIKQQKQFLDAQNKLYAWREREVGKIQHLPHKEKMEALERILKQALESETNMANLYIQKMTA